MKHLKDGLVVIGILLCCNATPYVVYETDSGFAAITWNIAIHFTCFGINASLFVK